MTNPEPDPLEQWCRSGDTVVGQGERTAVQILGPREVPLDLLIARESEHYENLVPAGHVAPSLATR